jgi:hypothetical protein
MNEVKKSVQDLDEVFCNLDEKFNKEILKKKMQLLEMISSKNQNFAHMNIIKKRKKLHGGKE